VVSPSKSQAIIVLGKTVNRIISVSVDWRILIDIKVESEMNRLKNPITAGEIKPLWIGQDRCCESRHSNFGNSRIVNLSAGFRF